MDIFQGFVMLAEAFKTTLTPALVLTVAGSVLMGIIIGALPGLTATMGVSLLVSLTFGLPTSVALAMIMGVYVGAIYGGSQSAVLMNIPGTPSAAATCLDGHPLAVKGQAGLGISTATTASFIGTLFGVFCLMFITPFLSSIALKFGAWEFFLLAVFGIMICGNLTADVAIKGWIVGMIGLAVSMVGQEEIYGYARFSYNNLNLMGGIALIPAMVGLFGISEVLDALSRRDTSQVVKNITGLTPNMGFLLKKWRLVLQSGLIGVLIGVIPGVGEDVAAWVSYDAAKRTSKQKELFGKGNLEGIIAAETANNACISGSIIPLLSLAIPGSAVAAVVLGAIWIHGVRPGPLLFFESPDFLYEITAIVLVASFFLLVLGLGIARLTVRVLEVRKEILMPIVASLCIIGSFAINVKSFDILVMLCFGIFGFIIRRLGYPAAPMTLGIILGPMADSNLRRALMLSDGSIAPFFTRPISLVLVIGIALLALSQALAKKPPITAEVGPSVQG
jgi:putative tricarboxylic transport membrane protein